MRSIGLIRNNLKKGKDGLVAEEWEQMDALGMLQQSGALPAP